MKIVSLLFFLFLFQSLKAEQLPNDSLVTLLLQGKSEFVIEYLTTSVEVQRNTHQHPNDPEQQLILMAAAQANGDTSQSSLLRKSLLIPALPKTRAEALIARAYTLGNKFFTQPELFFYLQDFGVALSAAYREPLAQFSFLQQKFSMYQMTGNVPAVSALLKQMDAVSRENPYLEYQTDIFYALYYAGIQHDSCAYFFEHVLDASKQFLGKPNHSFLVDPGYATKKDSGVLASTIVEYAKHYIRKGDLKKAGELLIFSDRHIPDTSSFNLLKVQNKIALATIYADLVNPERAGIYLAEAEGICEKFKLDRLRQTRVAATRAYILMANRQYAGARNSAQMAAEQFNRKVNGLDARKQALRLALCHAYLGDLKASYAWKDSAGHIQCPHENEIAFLGHMLSAQQNVLTHQYAAARHALEEALSIATQSKAIGWKKDALYRRYDCEKQATQHAASLSALEAYSMLNDSLYRTGQAMALLDVEAAYEKTIQDETIARLDAQHEISTLKIKAQQRTLGIVVPGMLIVTGLCIWLYRMFSQIKVANKTISKAMEEKNILLREIHHRVKNNLQVISSLLKLQSGYIKDDRAVQAIAEGRSRVQSMALLHQNLYKEDNLTGVNMNEYFENLIQNLFDTYTISPEKITLQKNIEPLVLDVDTVVPLGLITNELISNALKHAFPGAATGHLNVSLFEDDGTLVLKVQDDGIGRSSDPEQEGFGTKLIQSLSQKLEASITTRSVQGTEVTLRIKDYKKAA